MYIPTVKKTISRIYCAHRVQNLPTSNRLYEHHWWIKAAHLLATYHAVQRIVSPGQTWILMNRESHQPTDSAYCHRQGTIVPYVRSSSTRDNWLMMILPRHTWMHNMIRPHSQHTCQHRGERTICQWQSEHVCTRAVSAVSSNNNQVSLTNRSYISISMGNRTSSANAHLNYESEIYSNQLGDNNQNGA